MNARKLSSLDVEKLLGTLWSKSQSEEEKEKLMFAVEALNFITRTGQTYDFEDYRASLAAASPPLAIASFTTREEADAWLSAHPNPPGQASILIDGKYHHVAYIRKINHRAILRSNELEYYLGDMVREGVPPPVATFNTLEEAETWVHSQSEPPRQVFIQAADETYLAAYHEKLNLRALYPISIAKFANDEVSDEPD
jgi:hypothetical protein